MRHRVAGNFTNNFSCNLEQQRQNGRNEVNRHCIKID